MAKNDRQEQDFLTSFGLAGNPTSQSAYSLLDDIIARGGATDPRRMRDIEQRVRTRGTGLGGEGRAGAAGSLIGRLRAMEAGTTDKRRLSDLGLVEQALIRPGLESKNLALQKIGMQIRKEGGDTAQRQALFAGLADLAGSFYEGYKEWQDGRVDNTGEDSNLGSTPDNDGGLF
jgi:hypothetical protein